MLYRITAAAAKVGLHPATLRDYERRGLIRFLRDSSGSRILLEEDLPRIRRIYAERMSGLEPMESVQAV